MVDAVGRVYLKFSPQAPGQREQELATFVLPAQFPLCFLLPAPVVWRPSSAGPGARISQPGPTPDTRPSRPPVTTRPSRSTATAFTELWWRRSTHGGVLCLPWLYPYQGARRVPAGPA